MGRSDILSFMHAHLAPTYLVRRGQDRTCPRAASDAWDRTAHADEDPFSQAGHVALKPHVASVYFKCFKCFRGMLQVFYIDVAKVDQDVVHVAMVFSSVCPTCFICFRHLLQVFYLGVAKVDLDVAYTYMLQVYVSGVSYVCCKCFI
jgi:hypothetical protein